ncbi:cytochrome P450 [Kutzneria sp. CA-103260]|uniref:cytochrome P450 n=1 Tax=Kutzneria sp. CA-103260 TaxID=2802641 RepID=UPI001BA4B8EE|nr:cytochrome P450 [Kutzneria sp. CA-103260]QUQ68811.1 cytochrome P450 [Kutzneria sp. CA-103260]
MSDPYASCPTFQSRAKLHEQAEQCPVFYEPETLEHFVTRYDDVVTLLTDPRMQVARPSDPLVDAMPAERREIQRRANEFFTWWPNALDGPTHEAIRSALATAFSRRHLEPVLASARQRAHALLDDLSHNTGSVSWTDDFAGPLVRHVLAALLGVTEDQMRLLMDSIDRMLDFLGAGEDRNDDSARRTIIAVDRFTATLSDVLASATGRLSADLREMAAAPGLGLQIAAATAAQIISGAFVPVNTALSEGVMFWRQWRADGRSSDGAVRAADLVEETLRLSVPFRIVVRYPTEPITVGGTTIGAQERVTLTIGSANVDERRFPDALAFRPDVSRRGHLTFGRGPHHCPGARLARTMVAAMFTWLLENDAEIDIDVSSVDATSATKFAHFYQLKVWFGAP